MSVRWRRWIPPLTETDSVDPSKLRLSLAGQTLLVLGLVTLGMLTFVVTWLLNRRVEIRDQVCLQMHEKINDVQPIYGLADQLRQGELLINALEVASPGQRIRLHGQLAMIIEELNGLCRLTVYFSNQEAALMAMATVYATIIICIVAIIAPKGLQSVTRAEHTAFLAAAVMLTASLNLLQLGEQQTNSSTARQSYYNYNALLIRFSSSLANKQIDTTLTDAPDPLPLTSSESVSRLINAIDDHALKLPDPRLQISGSVAQQAFARLTGDRAKQSPPTQRNINPTSP